MHPKVLPRYINRSPRRHHLVCLSKLLEATIRQDTGKTTQVENLARRVSATQIKRIPTADIGKTVQWIGATAQELGDSSLNQPKTGKTEHCPFLFSIIFFFLYICKKIQFFPYL